ncbi:MAG: hypothetical protein KAS71_06700 [Bacteroidales bacterium]|nr:hypothetical protein [Bacteroidales bacterium]
MKKLLLFFLIVFLFACEKEISEKQADYFLKLYGTYLNDMASVVRELPGGGYVIVGTSETEERGTDISMIFTDEFGRQVGDTKYYGTEDDDNGNCILLLNDGLLVGGAVSNSDGNLNAAFIKTDFSGNIIHELTEYGGINDDETFCSVQKDDGGFFFVGYTNSSVNLNQLFIVSYNENLENQRVSANESGIQIVLKSIFKFRENQYFSIGTRIIDAAANKSQISVLLINEAGNYVVAGDFGDPANGNEFTSMVQQNDSTIFVLSTLKEAGSVSTKLDLRKLVFKFDDVNPEKLLYMKERNSIIFSEAGSLEANSLAIRDDGSMIMLATKHSADDKILLYQLDNEGNQVDALKEFGGSGDQAGASLLYSNESIVILGTNAFEGNSMLTLIKTDDQGNLWN